MTSNKQTTRNLPGKELQYFLLNFDLNELLRVFKYKIFSKEESI